MTILFILCHATAIGMSKSVCHGWNVAGTHISSDVNEKDNLLFLKKESEAVNFKFIGCSALNYTVISSKIDIMK